MLKTDGYTMSVFLRNLTAVGRSEDAPKVPQSEQWTATAADCLAIKDMGNIANVEADDLEL
jgi:hypothetical protein